MTDLSGLQTEIEAAWDARDGVNVQTQGPVREAVTAALGLLDSGKARVAEKTGNDWTVHQWLKKAVLLSFRLNPNSVMGADTGGAGPWFDKLAAIAPNVAVNVPLTIDGLKTCKALSDAGTKVNVTLCFSAAQALLAAKAGAAFVSPFVGRLDDVGQDGMDLIADIVQIYDMYPNFQTEVLVASVRHPVHVVQAAKLGAHVATLPPKVLRQLYDHPLTDKGLSGFLEDWRKTGQSILES